MRTTNISTSGIVVDMQLLAPTVIAQRPTAPGQITRSPDYLTGTVLRGGIASLWREQRGAEDEQDFQASFVQGQIRFGNAWPYRPGCSTWIVPQSAAAAKTKNGGWFAEGNDGVSDRLTRLLRDAEPDDAEPDDMEPVPDVFVSEDATVGTWKPLTVRRRLISRTALAPAPVGSAARGVAAAGQLYSFEALETGEQLRATLWGPDHLIASLTTLLEKRPTITVGQGRSRGLGLIQIEKLQPLPQQAWDATHQIQAIRRFTELIGCEADHLLLPVTLESDTMLRDNYLLACSSADPQEVLVRYQSGMPSSMRLTYALQATHWIGGWEQIRRLPRSPQLAVTQGSVWVFVVAKPQLPAALDWWNSVQATGLGERCAEGFGQVRLMHPFHDYSDAEENRTW